MFAELVWSPHLRREGSKKTSEKRMYSVLIYTMEVSPTVYVVVAGYVVVKRFAWTYYSKIFGIWKEETRSAF